MWLRSAIRKLEVFVGITRWLAIYLPNHILSAYVLNDVVKFACLVLITDFM